MLNIITINYTYCHHYSTCKMLSLTADTTGLASKLRVSIPEYRSGQHTSENSLKVLPLHIHACYRGTILVVSSLK